MEAAVTSAGWSMGRPVDRQAGRRIGPSSVTTDAPAVREGWVARFIWFGVCMLVANGRSFRPPRSAAAALLVRIGGAATGPRASQTRARRHPLDPHRQPGTSATAAGDRPALVKAAADDAHASWGDDHMSRHDQRHGADQGSVTGQSSGLDPQPGADQHAAAGGTDQPSTDGADIAASVGAGPTARGGQPRRRRGFGRRLLRVVGWGVAGVAGVLVVAVGVTAVLDAVDRRRITAPGELVELADGRRLHVEVTPGPDGGVQDTTDVRPTVVLEAGSGGFGATMAWLRQELAEHTTVVAYDRAGYGFSDPADRPVAAAAVVADLHEALGVLGIEGPLVLVGHSLGGGYVRAFAAEHPDRVAGLVLLDPVHEQQLERLPGSSAEQLEEAQQQLAVAPMLARLGVFRLVDPQAEIVAALPDEAGAQHRARSVTAAGMRAYGQEVAVLPDLLAEVGRSDPPGGSEGAYGGVPVRVLSASEPGEGETREAREVMDELHRELAERSPAASHGFIEGSDHLSMVVDAGHARTVATVVADLLDEVAGSEPAEAAD